MYKPPQNSNRVKSIRNKFENIENKTKSPERNVTKNGHRNNLNNSPKKTEKLSENTDPSGKHALQRQYSDPLKRNIKRTPAFRVDKNMEKNNGFQRNCFNRNTLFESKVKQFSAVKSNCDNNSNIMNSKKSDLNKNSNLKSVAKCSRNVNSKPAPILYKSKSSHEFQYIRSKFDRGITNNINKNSNNFKDNDDSESNFASNECLKGIDLSLLYTEPVPKSLRSKNINEKVINSEKSDDVYTTNTLKLSDKTPLTETVDEILKSPIDEPITDSLTDTLKTALKKPLPSGPAPKKPPRTFQHSNSEDGTNNIEKNISFLHLTKEVEQKLNIKPKHTPRKADPKYMLNKLENALRNNRLRAKRQAKIDISTTSGEDSDDSLLFRSKTDNKPNRTLPRLPSHTNDLGDNSAFNLNCLNGLGCANSNYEKIKEPNSSFFVGRADEEPVYAEPYHYRKDSSGPVRKREGSETSRDSRNSLYYMSTPVLGEGEKVGNMNGSCGRQISAENSSLSSFTSDLDSTPSPMEEPARIKNLIECFESRSQQPENIYGHIDSTNRVENLKNCLQKTLDRSFTCDSAIKDSDSDKNDNENKVADIITKFQTYIKSMPKYCKPKVHKDTLFYCCLIIEKVKDVAQIKLKYPSCVDVPHNIEDLCFPESDSVPLDCTNSAQAYSLLITNDKGERMFGYCRRVLPEGSTHCLPLAYCILSKYRAPRFYKKILTELETRHGIKNKFRDELIGQFYKQKFPKPGESIKIDLTNVEPKMGKTDNKENLEESVDLVSYVHINKCGEYGTINKIAKKNTEKVDQIYISERDIKNPCAIPTYIVEDGGKTELVMTLHPDSRYEDSDLKKLHKLPPDILMKIFSSLLLERKVILISSKISKLSSCVDSLQSILYPFTWHHTFIPILPEALWDIVESPTPVICGVLSTDVVNHHKVENGIVVDIDSSTVLVEEGDENKILSGSMQKVWKRSIALANKAAASMDYVHSVYLSDAYLQVFILCFKNYKKYIVNGNFQKEEFLKNGKTKGIRRFLKMFTETYMFLAFLDSVLQNPENLLEFDKKIQMYGSEDSSVILDKLLEWNR
ncbi:uncharacterized protein LOC108904263 isoform X2 [Anoplophora glabripennis]|uniref:uncharacterized protein LOC108904263 isoform X2 n=1 Tax=Anoplophora glabripennis TaxID=217634 RepID=UPI000875911F|nr:uncharacterized protein LOC108904263 isoform X2 [Anoplophora glabripennis]